jgi:peptidoglycan/LPS O-acetylase OafA/YrhL
VSDHKPRLAYRPGLDGVRALAVGGVVLYHARALGVSGGFLGVDVFFVLSGFLITSLLLDEHARSGTIDLVRFWLARVRRLLPAAVLVIALSLLAVALFSSEDLPSLRGDSLASLLYVNNWHQVLADRSYFAAFGRPSLLQHYWSLAVEEQFYLLWPPLLMLALRRMRPQQVMLWVLGAAVVSVVLLLVMYDPRHDATRVYYGTDTRATPLLLGVALAFVWPAMRSARPIVGGARLALDGIGVAGLALVVHGMLAWNDFSPFTYRVGLLLAAFGAALLIASVAHPSSRVGWALGWAPLVWIGRRSYGIYLWHWPVMAMTRPDLDIRASKWLLVTLQLAITLGLAALSYRYVEMPVRRGEAQARVRAWLQDRQAPRRRGILVGVPAGVLLFVVAMVAWPASVRTVPHGPASSASALASAPAGVRGLASLKGGGTGAPGGTVSPVMREAPRKPILMVGASVMLAAIDPLRNRLHAQVDAAVARQPQAIEQRLEEYRAAHALPPVVVVQTGENGPLYSEDLEKLREVLHGVPRVIFLTVRAPTANWVDDTNTKLRELVADWPQARIADWHTASTNPNLLWDGTHPKAEGAEIYMNVVRDAIQQDVPDVPTTVR